MSRADVAGAAGAEGGREAGEGAGEIRGPILFFDGTCALCHRTVMWSLRYERRRETRFAPLQGETFARLRHPDKPEQPDSVVMLDEGRIYTQSRASARLMIRMGGVWAVMGRVLLMLPEGVRDRAYQLIARKRFDWFGRAEGAFVPPDEKSERLLP